MGNKSKSRITNIDPTLNAELCSQTGPCKIYRNRAAKQYEKYEIRNGHDQNFQKKYEYRIQNPSNYLVNAYYAKPVKNMFGCDSKELYEIVIQRITKRLDKFNALSPQQALYVTYRVLKGYQILFKIFGIFSITQKMIGVDRDNKIKVWLNSNFSSNEKQIETLSFLSMPQSDQQVIMASSIIQLVSNKASQALEWDNFIEEIKSYGRIGFGNHIKIAKKHAILNQVVLQGSLGEKQDPFNWENSHKSKLTLYHTGSQNNWPNEIIMDQSSVRETPIFKIKQYGKNQIQNCSAQKLKSHPQTVIKSTTQDQSPTNLQFSNHFHPHSNQHTAYSYNPHNQHQYDRLSNSPNQQVHSHSNRSQVPLQQHQYSHLSNPPYQHQYQVPYQHPLYKDQYHQHNLSYKQDVQYRFQYPYQQIMVKNRIRSINESSQQNRVVKLKKISGQTRLNIDSQDRNIKNGQKSNVSSIPFRNNRFQSEALEQKIGINQVVKPLDSFRSQKDQYLTHMKLLKKYQNSRKNSQSSIPLSIPPKSIHFKTQNNEETLLQQENQSDKQSINQHQTQEIIAEDKSFQGQPPNQILSPSYKIIEQKNILQVNSQLTYLNESELMRQESSRVINKDPYNIQQTINQINTYHIVSPDPNSHIEKSGTPEKNEYIDTSDNYSTKKQSLDRKSNPNKSAQQFFALTGVKEMVSYRDLRGIIESTRRRRQNQGKL